MLHVGHAGSVGDIINNGVLREQRFPVVEDFALGITTGGSEQVENVLQEFADSLTKVCYSHATAGAVTRAETFVELKVRARYFPFRSQPEKLKRVLIVGWYQS